MESKCLDEVGAIDDGTLGEEMTSDEKQALLFAAGYVSFKHKKEGLAGDGSDLPNDMKSFIDELSRGALAYPSIQFLQFFMLAHTFFMNVNEKFCRTRLSSLLTSFPTLFRLQLQLPKQAILRVVNILLNNKQKRDLPTKAVCENEVGPQQRKVKKLSS